MKRILTIQDISCFGKCSLTVALPLLPSMRIETVLLPGKGSRKNTALQRL